MHHRVAQPLARASHHTAVRVVAFILATVLIGAALVSVAAISGPCFLGTCLCVALAPLVAGQIARALVSVAALGTAVLFAVYL